MKIKRLTFGLVVLLIICDLVGTLTLFFFKKISLSTEAIDIHSLSNILNYANIAVCSPYFWLGILSMIATFILWATILSNIDLSIAYPLSSLSYVYVPVLTIFVFHEHITTWRWVGIFFIAVGISLLSIGTHKEHQIS